MDQMAALKKGASTSTLMNVSEKGAVSISRMGRFPVTQYKEQWLKHGGLLPGSPHECFDCSNSQVDYPV